MTFNGLKMYDNGRMLAEYDCETGYVLLHHVGHKDKRLNDFSKYLKENYDYDIFDYIVWKYNDSYESGVS